MRRFGNDSIVVAFWWAYAQAKKMLNTAYTAEHLDIGNPTVCPRVTNDVE